MSLSVGAIETQIWIVAAATVISLAAFIGLILIPSLQSFGRPWEKVGAAFLSIFVLITLVMIGIAVGVALVLDFPKEISDLFSQG